MKFPTRSVKMTNDQSNQLFRVEYNKIMDEISKLEVLKPENFHEETIIEIRMRHLQAMLREIDGWIEPAIDYTGEEWKKS